MAAWWAGHVARPATLRAMRIFGGYGYSLEFNVERLYRDAPLLMIGEGSNEVRLGSALFGPRG